MHFVKISDPNVYCSMLGCMFLHYAILKERKISHATKDAAIPITSIPKGFSYHLLSLEALIFSDCLAIESISALMGFTHGGFF